MGTNPKTSAAIAALVIAFSAFILYITRPASGGGLDVSAVALVGPFVTMVVQNYFHGQSSGQGAAISAAGATSAIAATAANTRQIPAARGAVAGG